MKKNLIFICLALLFIRQFAAAQTQPVCASNLSPSVDFCQDACVYCNLSGFSGTTSGFSNQFPPGGFCGTIENEQWVAFVAVATSAEITATPSNCSNGNGIQIALYPGCDAAAVGCNGGADGFGQTPVSIDVNLVPGQTYFLMIDGYAGDVCDFTLNMTPPAGGSAYVTAEEIILCPGETYTIDGVAYTAPNAIPVILAENGDCDSILVYNLIAVQTVFVEETHVLCQDETVTLQGQTYSAPDTIVFDIPGSSGCDSVLTYYLQLKEYNYRAQDVFFCSGESVVVAGATYSVGGIVQDTIPGTTSCDTIISYSLQYILDPGECPSCSPTFLHTIGFEGQDVRGHGIYASPDGYMYVTGSKQDSSMLLKITPAGTIVWTRTFDFLPGRDEHIAEIIFDADNMIGGSGRSDTAQADYTGFAFRYDPAADALLWARNFADELPDVNGILEAPQSGNYVIYYQQTLPDLNAGMMEVDKSDGSFVNGILSKKFDNGGPDNFNSMLRVGNNIFAAGTYTGFGAAIHSGLTLLNNQGNVAYALEHHVPDDIESLLSGRDLLVEGGQVYSAISGNETGYDLHNSNIFLQRNTSANGNLSWIKRLDLAGTESEIVDEIVSVPDGFILYCRGLYQPANVFYLVKTDKLFNVLWSKQVNYGTSNSILGTTNIQSQLLVKGGYLYAVATVSDGSGHDRLLLMKTHGDATLDGDCDFITETPATSTIVVDPKRLLVFAAEITPTLNTVIQQAAPATPALALKKECQLFLHTQTDLTFCSGQSVVINGVPYTASGTVTDTVPGISCDTIVTYNLTALILIEQTDTLRFCPGESVTIDGITYSQSGTVADTILGIGGGCDTIITYTLVLLPQPVLEETVTLCPGESVTIGGIAYNQSGTVTDTIPGIAGCDTIATYTLVLLPQPVLTETLTFCPGESVTIGGISYNQSGTVTDTIPGIAGCDTIITYTLVLFPQPVLTETRTFCPGESVTIDGISYNQSGTVTDTIPGIAGCDTIITYTLVLLPHPVLAKNLTFCAGDSVAVGGIFHTQPGVVTDTIPAISGCDTIITYTLQYLSTPNSSVSMNCPDDISVSTTPGSGPVTVDYNLPSASSDCECPGIALTRTSGFDPGSVFPTGTTQVCYAAKDSCGNTAACCFDVVVQEEQTDQPCDVKVIGCMRYELLTITKDAVESDYTYRIRVTNSCTNKMIYTAIQVPDGIVALEPEENSVYTAPGGRLYDVRNPNFSPFYSIRFKSKTDSIANGQSDIFEYVLPGQALATYIHVASRLHYQVFYEAHLNTFYCPIGVTPSDRSDQSGTGRRENLRLYPNPTTGALYADLSDWRDEQLQLQIFDSRGLLVQALRVQAGEAPQPVQLSEGLANGMYFLKVLTEQGERRAARFVLQR